MWYGESKTYRYLVKYDGRWVVFNTHLRKPNWVPLVSDVIWLKADNMIASWWQMRNGLEIRISEKVDDAELALFLLSVVDEECIGS